MHQYIGRKKNILFLFLTLFFLSSINNQLFVKKKQSFYNVKSIKVVGLDSEINLEIEDMNRLELINNSKTNFLSFQKIKKLT